MGKWAERLAAHLAEEKSSGTPSTALTKPPEGGAAGLLSVLAVPRQGCTKNSKPAANDAAATETRPYRLSRAEADVAHAEPWDDAACGRFVARVALFMRRGIEASDADDLAERLHLRDVQADDRRLCLECRHLAGRSGTWRCGNHRAAGLALPEVGRDLAGLLQRCAGFGTQRAER
jgi:hypothetical protein